jgi:hypothetical protein
MKVSFLNFIQTANSVCALASERGCVIAAGVALAVSAALPLPSSEVEAPGSHYNFNNLQLAKDLIAAFNEQIVFDVREALDETREFWMLRYNAAHLSQAPVFDMGIGFYDNLLGVAKFVDPESHIFNNQYKYEIFALYRAARDVICELQKSYV